MDISEIISSRPVDLNRFCKLNRQGIGKGTRGEATKNGLLKEIKGQFIKDYGKWVVFQSKSGFIECVSKWDILYGDYSVTYIEQ